MAHFKEKFSYPFWIILKYVVDIFSEVSFSGILLPIVSLLVTLLALNIFYIFPIKVFVVATPWISLP